MAPKAKKEAKSEKKPGRPPKAAAAAKGGKAGKAAANDEALLAKGAQPGAVDQDELEEQEDAAAEAAATSGSGNAAALAAASGGATEMSASFKNFRHHPDMENFYRFIYDNDLRHEALHIIDEIMVEKRKRKEMKHAKSQAH